MTTWQAIKYDNAKYWDKINHISKELSVCQSPKTSRAAIIKLIKVYNEMAHELSSDDLLGGGGAVISADLCILLGMRYDNGSQDTSVGYKITEKDDPLLFELLGVSSSLDIDNNQPDKWAWLFKIIDKL